MLISKILIAVLAMATLPADQMSYRAQIEKWRQQHEQNLKAEDGWLTVVGRFWLKEGESTMGTGPENNFVLPQGSAPGKVGTFDFHGGKTDFHAAPGVAVTVNVGVAVSVNVGVSVSVNVGVPVTVNVGVSVIVKVGVAVGVTVCVTVCVTVSVTVGVTVCVTV